MSTTNHRSDHQSILKQEAIQRPAWLDSELYPFQSRFVDIEGNRMHYIDEGSGPILFLLHPSIGWSFMYADIIKELRTQFRYIALDLPGFGLSAAVPGYHHTLTNDSRLIERFIQALGLTEVTLLAHDITGSIGLGVVTRRPEWFRAVIILPGFVWPLEEYPRVYRMVRLVGSPLFRELSVHFNLLLEYTLKSLTKKPNRPFSEQEKRAYRAPMADRSVRSYPSDLFKSAVRSHDYLADLEQRLSTIQEMPALLIFGETDGLVKLGWLNRFERIFPRHRSIVIPGFHHFPQVYDAPRRCHHYSELLGGRDRAMKPEDVISGESTKRREPSYQLVYTGKDRGRDRHGVI